MIEKKRGRRMAKAIMVQGTMSNAGKSFIVAALCRIFKQDGYKVAPFKSQNMALNSYITKEGLEMGRAQVMQAEAAGVEPDVRMNPILLKPTNEKGSQVILHGEVLGDMTAKDYFAHKRKLVPEIMKAYDALAQDFDIIVLEGAGSPAEINLKADDIVNMGMAKLADAPVLLVGDIDRGGVFAALAGTLLLLEDEEKDRIKGLLINKFRGDVEILRPGLQMIEDIVHKPVVGVVPYMHVDIDDEDSLSTRLDAKAEVGLVDLAIIKHPRLSNFTDFNVFERIEGVSVRYVETVKELQNPDMIILPGSKNTMADLKHMRQSGMEAAVIQYASKGGVVFGICGGYQMLGESLEDPHGVEEGGSMKGMCLLPGNTRFGVEKRRTQVKGSFGKVEGTLSELSGKDFEGYEIHMGQTYCEDEGSNHLTQFSVVNEKEENTLEGSQKGHIYGSYVHGIFDAEGIAHTIIKALLEKKGIQYELGATMALDAYKESQYDALAANVREHLDMDAIYQMMGM